MKTLDNNPYAAHQDISLLLPWHVNKTLQGPEASLVENHLRVCLTCRRELAALQKLAAAVQQEGAFDSAAQVSFSQLKKRIHTTEVSLEKAPETVALPSQRHGLFRLPSQSVFALAAVILLSLLVPRFIAIDTILMDGYRTLSDAENSIATDNTVNQNTDSQNTLRVIFANGTAQAQIDASLATINGRVIDGPNVQGIYTVAVDGGLAAVLDKLALLRNNAAVIFAEPAYALLSATHAKQGTKQ